MIMRTISTTLAILTHTKNDPYGFLDIVVDWSFHVNGLILTLDWVVRKKPVTQTGNRRQ